MEFFKYQRSLLESNTASCPDECSYLQEDSQHQHVPPLVIIIVSLLGTCFLLVSYYAIIVKYCKNSRRTSPQSGETSSNQEDFLHEGHGSVVDHPIWYIKTVGLEQSIIDSISIFKYKKGEGLIEGMDCSVCLGEFEDDENLRLLPKCSHAFHLPCIDTWLTSHTSCPLCRAPIVAPASAATTPNLNDSSPQEEPQMVILESREDGFSRISEGGELDRRSDLEIAKEDETSSANSGVRRDENQMQGVRRSLSMDFMGNSSKGRSLQKLRVSMKRSFSSGGKILLSRPSGSNRSSILPL